MEDGNPYEFSDLFCAFLFCPLFESTYTETLAVQQEDGNYDVKFHDQLLGEKKGLPIEDLLLPCFV